MTRRLEFATLESKAGWRRDLESTELTPKEVRAFADKLEEFGNELTVPELALLTEILSRAAAASETEGTLLAGAASETSDLDTRMQASPHRALLRDITGV